MNISKDGTAEIILPVPYKKRQYFSSKTKPHAIFRVRLSGFSEKRVTNKAYTADPSYMYSIYLYQQRLEMCPWYKLGWPLISPQLIALKGIWQCQEETTPLLPSTRLVAYRYFYPRLPQQSCTGKFCLGWQLRPCRYLCVVCIFVHLCSILVYVY